MRTLITLLIAAALIGCKGGDSGSTELNRSPEPAPTSPFDPNSDYAEVNSSWAVILNPYIEVRYSSVTDLLYVCDEDFCRLPTKSDVRSSSLQRGECMTSASFQYGAFKICFSEIINELTMIDSVWVSIEEI
jgi:hypothetical protein